MFIANDRNGNRIHIDDANVNEEYFCPICNSKLRIRDGKINVKHFAHIDAKCKDTWNYDMSEWHLDMQSRFPKEQREVIVKNNGHIHKADILYKNMVIEFQHSPISYEEIVERNNFYNNAGYNVAWVFDVQEQYNQGRIKITNRNDDQLIYHWNNPLRCLNSIPVIKENSKDIMVYLYWIDEDGYECFNHVIWTPEGYYNHADFKTFKISNYCSVDTSENNNLEVEEFFITKEDLLKNRLDSISCQYQTKYYRIKGKKQNQYICPRTNIFGIKPYGESACRYCRYCAAIKKYGVSFISYCCFPNQVNEIIEGHEGYESSAPEY